MRNLMPIIFLTFMGLAVAQNEDVHSDVSKTLDGMNATSWALREKAFRAMPDIASLTKKNPVEADRLRLGLVGLLATENAAEQEFIRNRTTFASEEHSEYYASLVKSVVSLNDERAIPSLIGAITTGGMATRGLARFGDKAIDPVVDLFNTVPNPGSRVRSSALITIRDMLMMNIPLSQSSHVRIKQTLTSALKDPEFDVRWTSLAAIEYLEDREDLVPAIRDVAENDPGENSGTGHEYTLRPTAQRLLQKIANHEPPPVR